MLPDSTFVHGAGNFFYFGGPSSLNKNMSSITDSIYRYCELFRGAGVSVAGFYESFRTFLVPLEDHSRITDPGHNVLRLGGPVPAGEKADGGAACQMFLCFRQDIPWIPQ